MEKLRVAFIGLGVMGYPMAGYLSKAGYETKVYNRTKAKADKWAEEYQGVACETPREAAEGCDIVFTCVGNDDGPPLYHSFVITAATTIREPSIDKTGREEDVFEFINRTSGETLLLKKTFNTDVGDLMEELRLIGDYFKFENWLPEIRQLQRQMYGQNLVTALVQNALVWLQPRVLRLQSTSMSQLQHPDTFVGLDFSLTAVTNLSLAHEKSDDFLRPLHKCNPALIAVVDIGPDQEPPEQQWLLWRTDALHYDVVTVHLDVLSVGDEKDEFAQEGTGTKMVPCTWYELSNRPQKIALEALDEAEDELGHVIVQNMLSPTLLGAESVNALTRRAATLLNQVEDSLSQQSIEGLARAPVLRHLTLIRSIYRDTMSVVQMADYILTSIRELHSSELVLWLLKRAKAFSLQCTAFHKLLELERVPKTKFSSTVAAAWAIVSIVSFLECLYR